MGWSALEKNTFYIVVETLLLNRKYVLTHVTNKIVIYFSSSCISSKYNTIFVN